MGGLSRRHLLGGLAMLPAAAHAGLEPITIVCPNVSDVTAIDVLNAKTGGHFAANGLDATVVGSGTGVGGMQQLVAGRCQFLRGAALDLIKASARQSVPVLSIGMLEHAITYVLVSSAERPIHDPAMLRGKRVGVFAVASTTDNYLDLMLHHAGVPPDAVERQGVGANPATFDLVRAGRLDGIVMPYESAWPLLHPAQDAVVLQIADFVPMPGRCYLTTRRFADESPALALGFVQAVTASVLEIMGGPTDKLIARCAATFDWPALRPESADIVHWQTQVWMAQGRDELLRNSDAGWRSGVAAMAEAGLGTVPSAAALYTNRFVEQASPR